MPYDVPVALDHAHRRHVLGGEPMIFHCHHYNCYLMRTVMHDAPYVTMEPVVVGAAAEAAYAQANALLGDVDGTAERAEALEAVFRWAGFGALSLAGLTPDGGTVVADNSHFSMGWQAKWGASEIPVCAFAAGWLAGAAAALFDLPLGSFAVRESACHAVDASARDTFVLTRAEPNYERYDSVGLGALVERTPLPADAPAVDYDGIYQAVTGMPLAGDARGDIAAFGVYLTHMYANFYNRVSFEFHRRVTAHAGEDGARLAARLLVEAGHVCAFNTFGGIMKSAEWDALVRPNLKTREDWVHGMVAVTNALGWGRWHVAEVGEESAEFVIHNDYESSGYTAMVGRAEQPVSWLAQGGVSGLMNLVYLGDIHTRPKLDDAFYEALFRGSDPYVATPLKSEAMGDPETRFRVARG